MALPDEQQSGSDLPVGVANVEQAGAWNGDEGDHWTAHEARYDAAVRPHGVRLYAAAHIAADDRVLDIGCGCGESTRVAARTADLGMALGVDLSRRMIERARERARADGLTNVRFEQADAQVYPFEAGSFDGAISRFGAMFFGDPVAAFSNVCRALRPGGRLNLLAWQAFDRNEWLWAIRQALAVGRTLPTPPVGDPGPFGLADPDRTRDILMQAGFADVDLEELNEPVNLGADSADAFDFVSTVGPTRGMLEGLDASTTARALEALRTTLVAHDTGQGVLFDSRTWLITARRP